MPLQESVGDLNDNSLDSATSVGSRTSPGSSRSAVAFQGGGANFAAGLDQPSPSSVTASQSTLDLAGNRSDRISLSTDSREPFDQGEHDFVTSSANGQAREDIPGPCPVLGSLRQGRNSVYQSYSSQPAHFRLMRVIGKPLPPRGRVTGFVYVRRGRNNSEYFNIGWTTKATVEDLLARPDKCTADCPIVYPLGNPRRFAGAMRAKALIHAHLHESRYRKQDCQGCGGKTNHGGGFKASEDDILRSVQVFTDYVSSGRAYDENGKPTPFGEDSIEITISHTATRILGPTVEGTAASPALDSRHGQDTRLGACPECGQNGDLRPAPDAQGTVPSDPRDPPTKQTTPGTDAKKRGIRK